MEAEDSGRLHSDQNMDAEDSAVTSTSDVTGAKGGKRHRRKGNPTKIYRLRQRIYSEDEVFAQPSSSRYTGLPKMGERRRHVSFSPVKSPTKRKAEAGYSPTPTLNAENDVPRGSNDRHESIMWYPLDANSIALDRQDYQPLYNIAKTVHLKEYFDIRTSGELLPRPINEDLETGLADDLMGLWFRTGRDTGHNRYGNIRLVIDFNTFMQFLNERGNVKFYLYEIYQSPRQCTSRFIVAEDTDYNIPDDLAPYEIHIPGGPLHCEKDELGLMINRVPSYIRKYQSEAKHPIKHEVEFFLKVREELYRELFLHVHPVPQDHSEANDGEGEKCPKYRLGFGDSMPPCPFPLSKAASQWEIEEDWTVTSFSNYTAWIIHSRLEEKLFTLGSSHSALQQLGNALVSPLLRIVSQKANQMFEFVVNRNRGEKREEPGDPTPHEDEFEKVMENLEDVAALIDKHVEDYSLKFTDYVLSEETFSYMVESGKLAIDLGEMVEKMSHELGDLVCGSIETLATAMKVFMDMCEKAESE